ncbi:MAG: aldo/keto reductase family protein [bacterium]
MQYRRLGNAGIQLSEIGLGSWLTYSNSVEQNAALKCVKTAYESGINFFDTADVYNQGQAEAFLGKALQQYRRSDLVIASKCFFPMSDKPNDQGLSRKHIFESVHTSLKRLKTDYLDIYQCHRYDVNTPIEETVLAMSDLVRQGKILYWGVSQWSAAQVQEAIGTAERLSAYRPQSNQPIYNLINRSLEIEVMKTCHENGLGIVVFSPLAQGVLTGKYTDGKIPDDSRAANPKANMFMQKRLESQWLDRVDNLGKIASKSGVSLPLLALAWTLRFPAVTSAIIGASKAEQVVENVKASGISLSQDVLNKIDEIMGTTPLDQFTGQQITPFGSGVL